MNYTRHNFEMPDLNLSYTELKDIMQMLLSNYSGSFDFNGLLQYLTRHLNENKIGFKMEPNTQYSGELQQRDKSLVREIIWDLIIDRYLSPGGNGHDQWPNISITSRGREFFETFKQASKSK